MKLTSSRNPYIDAFRGVGCLAVVFLHCAPAGTLSDYIVSFARFAVPFFILVSGWFSDKGANAESVSFAKRKLKDMGKLAAVTILLYIIWNSLNSLLSGQGLFAWLYPYLNFETVFNLFVFNRALFINATMYYLLMMIYVYFLFICLTKFKLLKFAVGLIPLLLIANIVMGSVLQYPWYYSGNFLFTGLPFFLLGNRIHHFLSNKSFSLKWSILMLLFGIMLTIAETILFGRIYCYLGTVLLAVSILLLCVQGKNSTHFHLIASFGKKYSMAIFILHCGVRDTINILTGYNQNPIYKWLLPIICVAVSSLIYYFIHIITKKFAASTPQ